MSIQSEITRIAQNVSDSFDAVAAKGGTRPQAQNSSNLPDAILSIPSGLLPQIVVTAPTGSTVTCTKGGRTLTATEVSGTWTFDIPDYGTWVINASKGSESASESVEVTEVKQYSISLAYTRIYGVQWDGTATTAWSRTDDAAGFTDPVPAVDNGGGSSPFDNLYPWSGMVKEERTGGTMVKIPKFWFKWTKSGNSLKLQIADSPVDGFTVSPAHQDRGDGKGERDYVYVGRYHCCTSNWKSQSGNIPAVNITRSSARSSIHNLGTNIWQYDFAMWQTIFMLYLVEFADWNSQAKIGYGCGNNDAAENMGATDNMQYHTGTAKSSRTTYGVGVQYRWIEDLWGNVYDWLDGCYNNGSGLNLIKNPANFSDSSGGTNIGMPSTGYPTVMSVANAAGFEYAIYPTAEGGSDSTYVPDSWNFDLNRPCLYVGGNHAQRQNHGLFYANYNRTTSSNASISCRLQELP